MHRETPSRAARQVVDRFEASLSEAERRRDGAHYTPHDLAAQLTALAMSQLNDVPRTVCDPACGAGAFLLAAADAMVHRGIDPTEVVTSRLAGAELDPTAASAARAAMRTWAGAHDVDPSVPDVPIVVGDALEMDAERWPLRAQGYDMVIGNPPFLGQLSATTTRTARQREVAAALLGAAAGYSDTASLFLVASARLARPDGVVLLLQPHSFLAARSTQLARDRLIDEHQLLALWGSDEQLFDAAVRVCAPVLRCHGGPSTSAAGSTTARVELWWGGRRQDPVQSPSPGESWGRLGAAASGLPVTPPHGRGTLAEIASATAGFRDEFYALAGAAQESSPDAMEERSTVSPRLVTVGMIDPGFLRWGTEERRLAGRSWTAPRVALEDLERSAPRVRRWCSRRLVPKVLVATQTKIIEAVGDPVGDLVPVTPTISIEPEDPLHLWRILAAVSAPPVSARAAAEHFGSGLGGASVRLSAKSVLEMDLPLDDGPWDAAAQRLRQLSERLQRSTAARTPEGHARRVGVDDVVEEWDRIGRLLCASHDVDAEPVMRWWLAHIATRMRALPR